jgi:hypothetical protein
MSSNCRAPEAPARRTPAARPSASQVSLTVLAACLLALLSGCARQGFESAPPYAVGQAFDLRFASATLTAGVPGTLILTALDGRGYVDPTYAGTVGFTANDANAWVPAAVAFAPSDLGRVTLSDAVRSTRAARLTVTATARGAQGSSIFGGAIDNASTQRIGSGSVAVRPGPAKSLALQGLGRITAGTAVSVTVTVLDTYGNVVDAYASTLVPSTSDPTAQLPQAHDFGPGDAGQAALGGLIFTQTGLQSLTLTDRNNPSLSVTLTGLLVHPSTYYAQLSTDAATAVAGVAQAATLQIFDPNFVPAPHYTGTLRFSSDDPAATYGADVVFVDGQSLQRVANAVTFKTAGSYLLRAVDLSSPATVGVAPAVNVVAAAADHLLLSAPASATAGTPFTVALTALDPYNNFAPSFSGAAAFTSSDINASLPASTPFSAGRGTASVTLRSATTAPQTLTAAAGALTGGVSVSVGAAAASQLLVATSPCPFVAGTPFGVYVTAVDPYGNVDTQYGGTLLFSSNDIQWIPPGPYMMQPQDRGVAVVQLATLRTATATAQVRATDAQNALLTGNAQGLTVLSAAASQFKVTGFPSPSTAGVAATLSVTARDPYNNLATAYVGTLQVTSNDPNAVLPLPTILSAGAAGQFSSLPVTLQRATNTAALSVADTGNPSIAGSLMPLVVLPAVATNFTVSGYPSPATALQAQSLTVVARDAFANVATGYLGTVAISSSDLQASLPLAYVFTPANGGISPPQATTLKVATNTATLTATDVANAAVLGTQSGIVIQAAAATSFLVAGYPCSSLAGSGGNITVSAVDAAQNVATGYAGTVQITSTDAAAGLPANYAFVLGSGLSASLPVTLRTTNSAAAIVATDVVNSAITGRQTPITVYAAPSNHFVVQGMPSPVGSGVSGTVRVTALDVYNNVASTYAGTVQFTSNDGAATLPGNYTFLAQDFGISSPVPVLLRTLTTSAYIKATDLASAAVTGQQSPIVVIAGPAVRFTVANFVSPNGAGLASSVTVTAYDAGSNVATTYVGTVQITANDPNALLPPNAVFTAAQAGVSAPQPVTLKLATSSGAITATDTASPSVTGVQSGIRIVPSAATTVLVAGFPTPQTAGASATLTVSLKDTYGNAATGYLGTLHVTSNDAQAALPADHAFSVADAGSYAGFSVALKTVSSTAKIIATDLVNASLTGQQASIVVSPGATAALSVSGYLSPTVAGAAHPASVSALDAYGNLTPAYRGTIALSSNDPRAVLPGAYTFSAADAGVAAPQSVTFKTATASAALTATDTTFGSITGSQSPIVVSAAGAASLLVAGYPCPAAAGTLGTVFVTAIDSYNNAATGYLGTVQFTSTDPQAGLPGAYTFVVANSGVSAGQPVTLKSAGRRSITATDVVTATLTGSDANILITALSPNSLQVSGYPASAVANTTATVRLTARDMYNNLASGYRGTVTVTSSDAQALLPSPYAFAAADAGLSAPLSVTLRTANVAASITGTDTPSALSGVQTPIVVQAAGLSTFAVTGYPTPLVAGSGGTFTVRAVDAYSNSVTAYLGTVNLTSDDVQATLPATYTFTVGNAGQSSALAANLKTLGTTHRLTAVDSANAAITGQQTPLVVSAAAPSKFLLAYAATVPAGSSSPLTVTAQDAYSNITSSYLGTVTFTSNDARATLPGTYTFTGSGMSPGLPTTLFVASSTASLTATDVQTGSISGTVTPIVVTEGPTAYLYVDGYPCPTVFNTTARIDVVAVDAFDNVTPQYRGTVVMTSNDPNAAFAPPSYVFTAGDAGDSNAILVTLKTVNNAASIVATDNGNNTITGSQSNIKVTATLMGMGRARAAEVTHFSVSGYPSPTPAGTLANLRIVARDARGRLVPSYSGTVQILSSDPQATLPGPMHLQHGQATAGPVRLVTAGTHSITVADVQVGARRGIQAGIEIVAGDVDGFALRGIPNPANQTWPYPLHIAATDAHRNVCSTYVGVVHLSSSDPAAQLPADFTFAYAAGGQAVLRSVRLHTAGTHSLSATDAAGRRGTLTELTVAPAAPFGHLLPDDAGSWGHCALNDSGINSSGLPCDALPAERRAALLLRSGVALPPSSEDLPYGDQVTSAAAIPVPTCLHRGERLYVVVSGETLCDGLAAADQLQAFDWQCDTDTGTVRFTSTLRGAGGSQLSPEVLLEPTHDAWRPNQVSVTRREKIILQTPLRRWWPVSHLRAGVPQKFKGPQNWPIP